MPTNNNTHNQLQSDQIHSDKPPSAYSNIKGVRGEIMTFSKDPFFYPENECIIHYSDGLVVIHDGNIEAVGDYNEIKSQYPLLNDIETYGNSVILPGFIDCHVHYVQTPMVASPGDTLLDWLNRYTFPTEGKFNDKDYASEVAEIFLKQLFRNGTTTANVFATTYKCSVDALFEASEKYNTRMICGKVLQDRNLPVYLQDKTAENSIFASEELLVKWHNRGRRLYSVCPRFAPTSTPLQLKLAGELYNNYKDVGVYMHTHLDESEAEIDWVHELFPKAKNYTDVYASNGLLGRRSIFAHCCEVEEDEWRMLHEQQCGIAHCPSSNLFLGDSEFKFWEARDSKHPCNVGIGTDIGAGTSFSILRQLSDAYKVAMLRDRCLSVAKGLYMATKGGAEALDLDKVIGSISPGFEADLVVLDLCPDEFITWRQQYADTILDKLFILQTLAPDNMVKATYVAGEKVYSRK